MTRHRRHDRATRFAIGLTAILLAPAAAMAAPPTAMLVDVAPALTPDLMPATDAGSESTTTTGPSPATAPASAPTTSMVVMVPTTEPENRKERYFGFGVRAGFRVVPEFVLGIIGLQDALGTFKPGFALDLGYRSVRIEGGRKKGGLDLGLSVFYDDYRFGKNKGVPCNRFETGGTRAGVDPLNCSDHFDTASPGNINGAFFREAGDAELETEYRLQNFRFVGGEITVTGWWALNPFFHIDLGAGIGGGVVLGKMVFFDTYSTQVGQAVDLRTPCATTGLIPADASGEANTGCQEVGIVEDSVPPALPSIRFWVGGTFSIIKNLEIKIRGGIGGPSIFHFDGGVYLWF